MLNYCEEGFRNFRCVFVERLFFCDFLFGIWCTGSSCDVDC